jgi:hypothetical protein
VYRLKVKGGVREAFGTYRYSAWTEISWTYPMPPDPPLPAELTWYERNKQQLGKVYLGSTPHGVHELRLSLLTNSGFCSFSAHDRAELLIHLRILQR